MHVTTHKHYDKAWGRLTAKQQQRALAAVKLWLVDPTNPKLRVHQLKGGYFPQYSISAGGDLRIHFLQAYKGNIILMLVGTHSQLYG